MMLIYKPQSIPCAGAMMTLWNKLARSAGFDGLHFVETLRNGTTDQRELPFKARVEFEPARTNFQQSFFALNYKRCRRYLLKSINGFFHTSIPLNKPFSFSDVAERSLRCVSPRGTYGGVFVGWDNTPRRGLASTIIHCPTREEFSNYLKAKILQTQAVYHTNYLFVNAWNEWAEGAILEPDETHRYEYLETIKSVLDGIEE